MFANDWPVSSKMKFLFNYLSPIHFGSLILKGIFKLDCSSVNFLSYIDKSVGDRFIKIICIYNSVSHQNNPSE